MRIITNSTDFTYNADVMVYTQGYEECDPSHSYGPAVRKSYMVHYITQGKGIFVVDGKTYNLSRGDLFFIEPGKEIYYEADAKEPWGYGWIGITGAHVETYLKRTSLMSHPVAHYDRTNELALIFIEFQRAYDLNSDIRDLVLNQILYKFLAFLVTVFPADISSQKKKAQDYVENAMEYCLSHVDEAISVTAMADFIGLDRSYLSRLFKKETGISLKDYIWKTKEEEACRLLKETNLPVNVIACSVGFSDSLHFSRAFKQKLNVTPSAYRHLHS